MEKEFDVVWNGGPLLPERDSLEHPLETAAREMRNTRADFAAVRAAVNQHRFKALHNRASWIKMKRGAQCD